MNENTTTIQFRSKKIKGNIIVGYGIFFAGIIMLFIGIYIALSISRLNERIGTGIGAFIGVIAFLVMIAGVIKLIFTGIAEWWDHS